MLEKDCAIANSDYIDKTERINKVSNSTPYSSGISVYGDFKTSFFDNLTYHFGMNYKGSCGYVAIAELLSYYDTYLSDSIIPEQYDVNSTGIGTDMVERRNSPGVLKDIICDPANPSDSSYGYDMTAQDYYESISSLTGVSLHAKLIDIGASHGFYDFQDDNNPCGTTFASRITVMEDYFSTILGYSEGSQYSFT